ncbi:hypothetical protein N9Z92_03105 [Akkermansiaceae bacterium]|nr:hypothetical protein [bacterium]MDB4466080.1 hypothetical protein [bacterium]MDB4572874.1 hypothetical protein [Akkermansiaceae bacterium]
MPILALVVFGFVSLRWEKKAHEEELRARCLALAEPLRREFFSRLAEVDLLREETLSGDIDSLPSPTDDSESLARFQEGEYQAVLGEAGALSPSGLPLRPIAAIRLIRTEEDPKRLAELTSVIVTEPSFITTQLLREAEARHQPLGIPLPSLLEGWEKRLERISRANKILAGREPNDLLSAAETFPRLQEETGSAMAIRTPSGVALTDESDLRRPIESSRKTIAEALPPGVTAQFQTESSSSSQLPKVAVDSGSPAIHFVIRDANALDQSSSKRRGFFAACLVIAAILSGIGMFALFRTVSRERELAERKGNLVAAVSHEMRTPVASIRLLAENLSTGAADTNARRTNHLGQLLEQSERLSSLIENVLSYSKSRAGHAK